MMGRKILLIAALLYVVVLGCVFWPTSNASEQQITGLANISGLHPYCAVAMQLQRTDWVDKYEKLIDQIADEGADTVSLVVDARQENGKSEEIYVDMRLTMTVQQLTEIIGHAKSRGLRVILMPIVLLDKPTHDEWRGTISPDDWSSWFDSYRDIMKHYASIAQSTGVDVLVVGSELNSSLEHEDEWIKTIKLVRDMYKGQITYSANWDRYDRVTFWKYLDFIGMNSYWKLGENPSVTLDEIGASWAGIQKKIQAFAQTQHKPVILLEAGWCSLANAATDPWDYTRDELSADPDLQQKLYEAFFRAWWGKPYLAGFVLWEMHPGGDPSGKGYTPQGKPAEQVMHQWLHQPRWDVATP